MSPLLQTLNMYYDNIINITLIIIGSIIFIVSIVFMILAHIVDDSLYVDFITLIYLTSGSFVLVSYIIATPLIYRALVSSRELFVGPQKRNSIQSQLDSRRFSALPIKGEEEMSTVDTNKSNDPHFNNGLKINLNIIENAPNNRRGSVTSKSIYGIKDKEKSEPFLSEEDNLTPKKPFRKGSFSNKLVSPTDNVISKRDSLTTTSSRFASRLETYDRKVHSFLSSSSLVILYFSIGIFLYGYFAIDINSFLTHSIMLPRKLHNFIFMPIPCLSFTLFATYMTHRPLIFSYFKPN